MTSSPVLSVRDLSVEFTTARGVFSAIRGISFDVGVGETVAVVGESGSGKSTTAASVNRLLASNGRIASGSIMFAGRDLAGASEKEMTAIRGAGIGLVPQDPMSNLNPIQRVGDQIAEVLKINRMGLGRAAWRRAIELLDIVGIPDAARRAAQYPHQLSGGMRQRVLIAMGLACRPKLLIADEPTSALDVTVQRTILDRLVDLTAELGTSVLLITHDLELAAERADKVLVMYRGEMVESGRAETLLRAPQAEYTRRLLAAAPSLTSSSLVGPAADSEPLMRLDAVGKTYPVRGRRPDFVAVEASSLVIPRGQTVSIVGESGSGKSTTARMALGLERPTAGSVVFDGTTVASMSKGELFRFRRRVQPVFQNPFGSLNGRMTIGDSIAEPLQIHGIGTPVTRRDRVEGLLDQVALPRELMTRLPAELSGGQRQRVAIARALALEPELIVLDEAVSALDVIVQAQILELLVALQRDLGLSYLFISHDLAVVRMISHHVHVMQGGRIVESGTPSQIFESPRETYTRELLAAIPGTDLPAAAA
ncbi:ABC transporter ATP-binding protein [Microbacterium sp. 11MF]|uniref:ABC transporter ATP-binding protein n=1 Tax=Microbacterium sp. 11MF TaxID=1169146 RepID=UPI00036068E6|nr:ABC transporter ATP-binding protein [Microbacterium sp. 11MF]